MKYPTIRVVFDRKKVATKKVKGLVQLEIQSERRRKFVGTGVKVYADQWNDRHMVVNSINSIELNERIQELVRVIQEWINGLIKKKEGFEFDKLDRFLMSISQSDSYIEFVEQTVQKRNDISEGTKRNHRKLLKSLRDYGGIVYFTDLTRQNIELYDNWLHSRGIEQSTIHSYHKFNKVYINIAVLQGLLPESPYKNMQISRGKSKTRKYLTQDELNIIKDLIIQDNSISRVRDLFLFQCYTGFSFSDLTLFDFKKNLINRDGKFVINDVRVKTGESFYIVLLRPALKILEKYDFELPTISNSQYNLRLKVLASYAEIDKPLTTHMARHSFAVMALNNGVKIEKLAKMMGHSDIATTQIYAKILDTELEKDFDMLDSKVGE